MAPSVFEDKTHPPPSAEVERALGPAAPLWNQLVSGVADRYPPIHEQWHFGGEAYGWSLRLKRGERIVVYLTPQQGHFLVGIVLGEKAVKVAERSGLPTDVLSQLERAHRYAEGRGIRLTVSGSKDLRAARALAAAKMTP